MTVVDDQNNLLDKQIQELKDSGLRAERNADYQAQMYASVQIFNNILVFIYYVIFVVLHILFLEIYLRGETNGDSGTTKIKIFIGVLICIAFFIYPYVIFTVEKFLYTIVTYLWAWISGQKYVYRFDQLFSSTSFYTNPDPNYYLKTDSASDQNILNQTLQVSGATDTGYNV